MSSGRKSFYAVRVGRVPGVYRDWPSAQKQILGVQSARYKGFYDEPSAQAFMILNGGPQAIQEQGFSTAYPPQQAYPTAYPPQQGFSTAYLPQQGYPGQQYQQPQYVPGYPQQAYPAQGYYEFAPQQYAAPARPPPPQPPQPNWDIGVQIWADGSAAGGIAGWGYLIFKDGVELTRQKGPLLASDANARATNNRAELTALLKAMLDPLLTSEIKMTFNLDSKYVIDCVTKWTKAWERNGWRKKDGQVPLNLDLIQAIQALYVPAKHDFNHVPAHTGIRYNEEADRLADEGRLMSVPATPIYIAGAFDSLTVNDDDGEQPLYG